MREAAGDLDFEEAARLRDEIKRLRTTELAVVDDPTAKYISPSPARGGGSARNFTIHFTQPAREKARRGGGYSPSKIHKPDLDDMGPGVELVPGKSSGASDEARSAKAGPRSTLGRPGMRGGWKSKRH